MKFSLETVGGNSGKIWEVLNQNGKMTVAQIEKMTEMKKDDVYVALGWLLREGKINSEKFGRTFNFFLI